MSDGAHLGVSAGRALGTILGGEPSPKKGEGMTPAQMRAHLEAKNVRPPKGDSGAWYSEISRRTGRTVLRFLDAHPEYRDLPAEDTWEFPPQATSAAQGRITKLGIHGRLKEAGVRLPPGLTGFMYGWGVNAAKYTLGAPPAPNPALLTIEVPDR